MRGAGDAEIFRTCPGSIIVRLLLLWYKHQGVPVVLREVEWTEDRWREVMRQGPHQSTLTHVLFLQE